MGAFLAILSALSILYFPAASALAGAIEQSLAAMPAENLAVSGATVEARMVGGAGARHYAFTSQGRPIRVIKN